MGTSCAAVDAAFQADAGLASVLVLRRDGGVLLANREAFFQAMTGPLGYGRTLFYRRPVDEVLRHSPLTLRASSSLEGAALAVMAAERGSREDVLVDFGDGWGSVAVAALHAHLASLYRARAAEVRQTQERFRALVENAEDVIVVLDQHGMIRYASREVEGMPPTPIGTHAFTQQVVPEDAAELAVVLQRLRLRTGRRLNGEFRVRGGDGMLRTFEYSAQNLLDDPAVQGVVVNFRDITARRALEEQLRHHALHDPLTGLANRQLLFDRVGYAIDRLARVPGELTVLYCDLDGFKQVNDTLGHALGDSVLVEAAQRLRGALRRGDTLARFGGDEFVVLAEESGGRRARELAGRLVAAFATPLEVEGRRVDVSVSIGHVTTSGDTDTATLLRQADLAMYVAKVGGRNQASEFSAHAHDAEVRSRRLVADLRVAAARGELELVYQPIFDARRGGMAGAEALLRWSHPELGPVSPAELVPLAEQHGLIERIGRWVVQDACRTFARWSAGGVGPRWVSVNVSARQLEPGFVDDVAAALHANGLAPAQLHVELTESDVAVGVRSRLDVLAELRELGVSVALDDFGTGYSSLSSVGHLPLDVVKIDRAFVTDLSASPDAEVILRGIVDLAHSLGFQVVAEGVERAGELRLLESIGCDFLQGFLLGRPESPAALERRWASREQETSSS